MKQLESSAKQDMIQCQNVAAGQNCLLSVLLRTAGSPWVRVDSHFLSRLIGIHMFISLGALRWSKFISQIR